MRVTGGTYGGRRIETPPGEIRPAMDRMRESVFSILGSALGGLDGLTVVDLFSGSGSMALEALSRGAAYAVLVERDRRKAPVIRKNLSYVEAERWKLVVAPAERYLARAGDSGPPFDLVFCDPPFRYPGKDKLLAAIATAGLVSPAGTVVIHFPQEDDLEAPVPGLELKDRRTYGRSVVQLYTPARHAR